MIRVVSLALFTAVLAATLLCARGASAGYTHYWTWHSTPEPVALGHCLDDMVRIADTRRDRLADDHNRTGAAAVFLGTSRFGRDGGPLPSLYLNGVADDAYEPFLFPLASDDDPSFTFVKTAHQPYDEVVVACLIVARDHFAADVLDVRSDGRWDDEWQPGRALYEKVFGRPAHSPLRVITHDPDLDVSEAPALGDEPAGSKSSVTRNLLISAAVFLAIAAIYWLTKRT
jgi:hypothetical protein